MLPSRISALIFSMLVLSTPAFGESPTAGGQPPGDEMNRMWGQTGAGAIDPSDRAALFRDGNYGMFIHWGLFSQLGNQWKGQTFYGIGEWILRQWKLPLEEYKAVAKQFNPIGFNAREIVAVAKKSGMRYIIITAKHHDGFAMFKSAHPFNVVDATPFARDPMRELAEACREAGLGFGFYYSHYQDWTAPGGFGGPTSRPDGSTATFEQYFHEKCMPQVKEICTQYGPLNFVWFDTPNDMPKELVLELAHYVREAQPEAMVCSRIGYELGDYTTQGDMEVPPRNLEGLWEAVDTTNDSWGYAWYDQNWKDSREILNRLVATVGRGGTYLLNVGPDNLGRLPAAAARYLQGAGEWIARYPSVITAAGPSPWGHALPWGDVTTQQNRLQLVVFDWPTDGRLFLPGLETEIESAFVSGPVGTKPVTWRRESTSTVLDLPVTAPDRPASVINVLLKGPAKVDPTLSIVPNFPVRLPVEFAEVTGAVKKRIGWMEKFGEWKNATQAARWEENGRAVWTVDVVEPGDYHIDLSYRGNGRVVWKIDIEDGAALQNQQAATSVYHRYPIGILSFAKPGRHTLSVSLVSGDRDSASLEAVIVHSAQ